MKPLYELTGDYKALADQIENSETPENEVEAMEALAAIADDIDVKIENIAKLWKNLEAEADAFKAEERRFRDKRTAAENKVARLKAYVHDQLTQLGVQKAGGVIGVKVQKNGGVLPLEFVPDKPVPDQYMIQPPPIINNELIREELSAGAVLEFAKLGERGTHVRIY